MTHKILSLIFVSALMLFVVAHVNAQGGAPAPFIGSVSPLAVEPASRDLTLTINGAFFTPDSLVRWNGLDHVPSSVTPTRIEVAIADVEIAVGGTAVVTVVNGVSSDSISNAALVHVARQAPAFTFIPFAISLDTFATHSEYAAADFNSDSVLDFVAVDASANTIVMLPGNGDGTLGSRLVLLSGDGPRAVAAGDFNGDGLADVAVVNEGSNSVSILIGNGAGSFTRNDVTVGGRPRDVVLGDVNADGSLDAIVSMAEPAGFTVLPGNGDGTFAGPVDFTIGSNPISIGVTDFDGDGRLDIALTAENDERASILAGRILATATISVADKRFDGTRSATITSCFLNGVLAGDSVSCTGTAAFDSAEAGSITPVTVSNLSLTGADAGRYALATNTASSVATIRANGVPTIVNPGTQSAYQSLSFTLAMSAADADGDPLTWSAQGLPPGITLNPSTGFLSGIPSKTGTFNASVTVSDGWDATFESFAWNVTIPLPGPATALTPLGSVGMRTPSFSWSAVALASYFALSVTDAASTSTSWYTPSQAGCASGFGICTVVAPRALAPGLVSWKVITWSTFGYGPWSNTPSTVIDVGDTSAPTPVPTGPGGQGTRTPTYTWTGIAGASWYQLSITDALDAVRDYWYSPTACTANACAATPPAIVAGKAKWRIRAWRSSGAGPWSAIVAFDATDAAPAKITIVAPAGTVSTPAPVFTWNATSIASYYLLQITDRDNVTTDRWYRPGEAACAGGYGVCAAAPTQTLKAGAASWRVLAWNASGYGPWSNAQSVVIEIPDPKATAPATISPVDTIASPGVTYHWAAVNGALTYRLSIRNNGTASVFSYSSTVAGCIATTDCSATPPLTLINGTAEWQVQAWTRDGFGPWSALVTQTVARPVPNRDPSAVRLLEYGWDVPTPAFVGAHIREMEQRPFDGVVMRLPDGAGQLFQPEQWNGDRVAAQLPILADIEWQTFDSNFLVMYAASSMDWFDDEQWGVVLQHAAFMAKAARACRCKGLMFDPEPYGPTPWAYAAQARVSTRTFAEYEAMVRARGRSFMHALQQEYPGIDLLTLAGYSYLLRANAAPDADAREAILKGHAWGLLPAFLNGLLDEAEGNTHIIDGQEQSYYSEHPDDFAKGDSDVRDGAFPYVAQELTDTYVQHVETGQPLYSDWLFGYFHTSKSSLGDGLDNAQRARLAEHHAYYAMKNVNRYVWVYSEKMNWWTGENLPAGAEEALRSAKRKFKAGESLGFDVTSIPDTAP